MIRAAVVGLGWWGRTVVTALHSSDVVRVTHGIDPQPDARAAWNGSLDTSRTFDEVLADPAVDAVILTTPHRFHAEQIVAAARAGKHVFCEKPLTSTGAEAVGAIQAVTDAGVTLGIGHERRFEPAVQELQASVRDGSLGVPLVFEGNFSQDKFLNLPPDNWRLSAVEAPVGPLSATGVHLVDLAISLFGRPVQVWARCSTMATRFGNGDTLVITLAFAGGATAVVTAVLTTPFLGRIAVIGSRGWTEIRDRSHPEDPKGWDVTRCLRGGEPTSRYAAAHPTVRANIEEFGRAAGGEVHYSVPLREMLFTACTVEAITASVRSGRVEPVAERSI